MVQTRRQTREGAPPPPSVAPFSNSIAGGNPPGGGQRARPHGGNAQDLVPKFAPNGTSAYRIPLPHYNRPALTLPGVFSLDEFVGIITRSLTGRDIHNVILAAPSTRTRFRDDTWAQPLRCQNCPPPAMIKAQHERHRYWLTVTGRRPRRPFPPCTTPADAVVTVRPCQGHALGYSAQDDAGDHGPDFMVCQHCVQKGFEACSMFVKWRSIDLCHDCSNGLHLQNTARRPPGYPAQCTCFLDDARLWLCTSCRMLKSRGDLRNALDWIAAQNPPGAQMFPPMHHGTTPLAPPNRPAPAYWIEGSDEQGESHCCYCGKTPGRKILSYFEFEDEDEDDEDDEDEEDEGSDVQISVSHLDRLIRICLYCRKQRFLTKRYLDP